MELKNKTVLVVGSGVSGLAAAKLLIEQHISCILYDGNENLCVQDILNKLPQPSNSKVEVVVGEFPKQWIQRIHLVVLSPGVPTDLPFVKELQEAGLPIWGEIELAYYFEKGKVVAITGTNGKTTTTALTGAIMEHYFSSVFVVGNIGIPYTEMAPKTTEDSVTVAEISSFQLETIAQFHPQVTAILNVTPDHLNRHHTMENYANAKLSITKNQTMEDTCVLNYDNAYTREFGEDLHTKVLYFSRLHTLEKGICLAEDQDTIVYKDGERQTEICQMSKTQLLGGHNLENVMAAVGMALCMDVPVPVICEAVYGFQAVEHRIEFVKEVKGVTYYNDSKGTNTDAAIKGIEAMIRPTVLIAGGYDKGSTYDDWIEACLGKMKTLILLGQTREKIAACAREHGFTKILFAESLEEAVQLASGEAVKGDAVLLSPACASWGMFKNYEQRGTMFKDYVRKLEE